MATTVPFLDLRPGYDELRSRIDAAVSRVMASGQYVLGAEVESFEHEFSSFVGARHGVGVASGLDALMVALSACDIGPGDEVIVPSHTFIATWLAVTHVGARVVPVEPGDGSMNLEAAAIESAITPRTRAIVPVHLYGRPADLAEINAVAKRHRLRVIDDAAQAHGAVIDGHRVGHGTDATTWSFYPGKNLGAAGDGGMVTTSDDDLARRMRLLRNYGSERKYLHETIGWNSRLDPMQAAILSAKLPALTEWNARRRRIAGTYLSDLASLPWLRLPAEPVGYEPVWHLFVVRCAERDALQKHLSERGVQTLIHYPLPPHRQPAYSSLGLRESAFPVANAIADQALSLPIGPHLAQADVQRVIESVRSFRPSLNRDVQALVP